jgi:hypothetical protein
MKDGRHLAITALRVVLGVVVLQRACVLALGPRAAETFAHTGWPNALRLGLAWAEITAAVLFLVPGTLVVGAWSLIAVFLWALALHVAHGDWDVGGLLVWTAAVVVVLLHRRPRMQRVGARS